MRAPVSRVPASVVVAVILVISAALNLWNVGFPLGYHIDEPVKVRFIQSGMQDFKHPILMLQLVRTANRVVQLTTDQQIVVLGRSVVALLGTLTVWLSYLLARCASGRVGVALFTAVGVALSPMLVVHAHYLKEDTVLTAMLLASMLALIRFLGAPDRRAAALLGLTTGLAFSSHYKSILLVPLIAIAPLLHRPASAGNVGSRQPLRTVSSGLGFAAAIAAAVFVAINWPLAKDLSVFMTGLQFEATHAIDGHDVRIGPLDYWFGFHLTNSLAFGMGWGALSLALGGTAWTLRRWHAVRSADRLLVLFVLLFYVVPEISPLKPAPDASRYMMPIVPVLIYIACRWISHTADNLGRPWSWALGAAAVVAIMVQPGYTSLQLTSQLANDTRKAAADWLRAAGGKAVGELHSGLDEAVDSVANIDVNDARDNGVNYLVASSFMYARFFLGSELRNQNEAVYRTHQRYVELFQHPYVEFVPAYRSFAFSNPVIRIVDIRTASSGASTNR